jgi:hypothetical protein
MNRSAESRRHSKHCGASGQIWSKTLFIHAYWTVAAPGTLCSQHPLCYKRLLLTLDGRTYHRWLTGTGAT